MFSSVVNSVQVFTDPNNSECCFSVSCPPPESHQIYINKYKIPPTISPSVYIGIIIMYKIYYIFIIYKITYIIYL